MHVTLLRFYTALISLLVVGCSGGSSGGGDNSTAEVTLSGRVTYDYIPHKTTLIGLNYNAIEARPGRGLVVELLNQNNQLIAEGLTDSDGNYTFSVQGKKQVRVRVKAQLKSSISPTWDVSVRDNTGNDALYVMDGSLASTGTRDSTRDLHADSGWTGTGYGNTRVAAPFAILDSLYLASHRFVTAGYQQAFPPLVIFWSTRNNTAVGDPALGEIGTTYHDTSAIYVLGEANSDTDEYDSYVVLHEWGHYLETVLSRTDSLGGEHSTGASLDMRLAMSEGFATSIAAMMLNNPLYRDSLGFLQSEGFYYDASDTNPQPKGWYSEDSVASIIYNYYQSSNNKTARNFVDVLTAITATDFVEADGAISIYTFADVIKDQFPAHTNTLNTLLTGQNIFGTDAFGANEGNDGGNPDVLPIYKDLVINGAATRVCSSNASGTYNKLGVHQFLRLSVINEGDYLISAIKANGQIITTNPNIEIYNQGRLVDDGTSPFVDSEEFTTQLDAGSYLVVVMDLKNFDPNLANNRRACFDVQVQSN
jgi:hypothetical protein